MSGSFLYKLSQYETPPPDGVWDSLSERLDKEFNPSDSAIQQKLSETAVEPSPLVWDRVRESISDNTPSKTPVVPLIFKRIAIAAILAGVVALAVVYFSNNSADKGTAQALAAVDPVVVQPGKTASPTAEQITAPAADIPLQTESPAANAPVASFRSARRLIARNAGINASSVSYPVEHASMTAMNAVNTLSPVSVDAPPLLDKNGNIIMDVKLVSAPNGEHIVVTGPNGEQTRISRKFIQCLSYRNGDLEELNSQEAREWNTRFREWRDQLLREASFIPSANNFLDIFELKDMIMER